MLIVSKDCCSCEDQPGSDHYVICHGCYTLGMHCKKPGEHVLVRHEMAYGLSESPREFPQSCTRRESSMSSMKRRRCDHCQQRLDQGYFFRTFQTHILTFATCNADQDHFPDCCQCNGDDFDMCLRCYRAGRSCNNLDHMFGRYYYTRWTGLGRRFLADL